MLTLKQQKFCRAYVETGNASEAYRRAYDTENMSGSTVNNEAYKLLQRPDITARIAEIELQAAERHKISVDSLIAELEEARQLARETLNPTALQSATMNKAKLLGLDKPAPSDDDGPPQPARVEITVRDARKPDQE